MWFFGGVLCLFSKLTPNFTGKLCFYEIKTTGWIVVCVEVSTGRPLRKWGSYVKLVQRILVYPMKTRIFWHVRLWVPFSITSKQIWYIFVLCLFQNKLPTLTVNSVFTRLKLQDGSSSVLKYSRDGRYGNEEVMWKNWPGWRISVCWLSFLYEFITHKTRQPSSTF